MARRPHPPHVRDRVLARVAAGELIADICAEPGQPSTGAVSFWARRDPAFAAALASAKQSGRDLRRLAFDPAKARQLLARLAAGETITSIFRDPAMPTPRAYAHWRAVEPAFAAEVARLNALKHAAKIARCKARVRVFHAACADLIVARVICGTRLRDVPEAPSQNVLARWRREQPVFDQALKAAIAFARPRRRWLEGAPPEVIDAVWERVLQGETLAKIGLDRAMPCRASLYSWMKRDAAFRDAVAQALHFRRDLLSDLSMAAGARRVAGGGAEAKREWEGLIRKVETIDARLERWGYYDD